MIDKGMVSTVSADGKTATVVPAFSGPSVTFPLVVPFFLAGSLTVKMPVVYATFPDNTGVILARMDGEWNRELSGDLNGNRGRPQDRGRPKLQHPHPWRRGVWRRQHERAAVRRGTHDIHCPMGAEGIYCVPVLDRPIQRLFHIAGPESGQ